MRLTMERLEELKVRAINPAQDVSRYKGQIRGVTVYEEHCMASELLELRLLVSDLEKRLAAAVPVLTETEIIARYGDANKGHKK